MEALVVAGGACFLPSVFFGLAGRTSPVDEMEAPFREPKRLIEDSKVRTRTTENHKWYDTNKAKGSPLIDAAPAGNPPIFGASIGSN